jgi:hypothetical protein
VTSQTPERAFQQTFVALLEAHRWVTDHTYPLRTKTGWRTGSTLKGRPDILALRDGWQIVAELKAKGGTASPEQVAVLSLFALVPGVRAWLLIETAPTRMLQKWIEAPEGAPAVHGFDPMEPADARRVIALSKLRKRGNAGQPGALQLPL